GGGNSHEAEYLHTLGFENVFVIDFSKKALKNFLERVPSFPSEHLIHKNFFNLEGSFDLIIEQTFFCALIPALRPAYAAKTFELLNYNGKIVGLLFNTILNTDKPPFGGCKREYLDYFKPYFNIALMEDSENSHESRKGRELFFNMKRKLME